MSASTKAGADEPGNPSVRRLSPEDLSILALENETVAGHTCKLICLEERIDPDGLRASIAGRLDRAPELCLRLGDLDGTLCWESAGTVDLSAQVIGSRSAAPLDEAGLRATVADLFEQRLDRSRPLWRIDVIPELAGGGTAVIWRIHHALADGATAMRIANAVLWDDEPTAQASPCRSPRRPPAPSHPAAASTGHHAWALGAVTREAPRPWRRSPFDGRIGAHRAVAFATVELAALHRVAAATDGATVNDAILTVVGGALRRWLEARHGHLGAVRVKVPVSLHNLASTHAVQAPEPGNRDSFFCLDLPLDPPDPRARLAAVHRATRVRKLDHDAERLDTLMRELGRASPRLRRFAERVLAHPRSFALNVSNVPGPCRAVHVLGSPVRAMYSIAEIRERHALRVAVASLTDTLDFGLCADPSLLPDVDRLAQEIEAEAAALVSGLPYGSVPSASGTMRSAPARRS